MNEKLIFEKSVPGRQGYSLPNLDVPRITLCSLVNQIAIREEAPDLPELSEVDVVRHFTRLSQMNYGLDTGFYPLGSCTMKYNPKINEDLANLPGFALSHPYQPEKLSQGIMQIIYDLSTYLCEISGMDRLTLQPAAGAHGELTGIFLIKAYHQSRQDNQRNKIIIPDAAHGTNPATVAMCGYQVVEIKSNSQGLVDLEELKKVVGPDTAGLMLTNPNTLGLFEKEITEIAKTVHQAGGLLYYDGANMNAILAHARPGDMGFDVIHYNLHKTFSTPHGGGGPGSGPVGVKKKLIPFLPKPLIQYDQAQKQYFWDYDLPQSIGRVKSFYGNIGVALKAYAYISALGEAGLKEASALAVLNANYLKENLKTHYNVPYDFLCKHEFVFTPTAEMKDLGIQTIDLAKRMMDYGFHPPTVYFPLIVDEALMVEPTETESKETLDSFIGALIAIGQEALSNPQQLKNAPETTLVSRFDETKAARKPRLRWKKGQL